MSMVRKKAEYSQMAPLAPAQAAQACVVEYDSLTTTVQIIAKDAMTLTIAECCWSAYLWYSLLNLKYV
ncbi:hypothetical protein HBH99_218150 [Parastagonospora nodorum]|nr:hypothetical protein HBH44_204830 [Parastagonospora nodorum]KAH4321394.1 hypothetical protein HBI00_215000 [Parastagonospora nodorum]KAH4375196.1 hypothetical protein HBH99_218150 [Parastagonospora nodorum]KAH4575191.1 hypothetical protein HBH83_202130 [Parastagonospora nodorum]KAH4649988.1 hypothetical protein HBH80_223080 [Parastagonospora nodorum]